MKDKSFLELAYRDFDRSANLKVKGFPTVFLEYDGTLVQLTRGYTSLENLKYRFDQANV